MSALGDLTRIISYTDSGVLDDMFEHDKNIGACAMELLAKHAHELAEKIRAAKPILRVAHPEDPIALALAMQNYAADLIDSESDRE